MRGQTKYLLVFVLLLSVSKLNAQDFAWAVSMGGPNAGFTPSDRGYAIKTDAAGNVYTTGSFSGTTDFDPGPGTFNLTVTSTATFPTDMFVQKLDANGRLVWAKQLVGESSSAGYAIVLDQAANVYITGYFRAQRISTLAPVYIILRPTMQTSS